MDAKRFEDRLIRMASPRVLLWLCHRSVLDRDDARTLAIAQEIARRIGASAAPASATALREAFAPWGWWSQTDGVPGHVILLDGSGDKVVAHDWPTAEGAPADALPEPAATLRLRLHDAIACAAQGGFCVADERCPAPPGSVRWKACVVPVRPAERILAVLCVLFAAHALEEETRHRLDAPRPRCVGR